MKQLGVTGAIESRHDPTSFFAMQHLARIEAQQAFVHLDTSKRVARASLKNASPIDIKYEVGDVVVFRRGNNVRSGKTSWSPAHQSVDFSSKPKTTRDAEALASHVLSGKPVLPNEIAHGQHSFVDKRTEQEKQEEREGIEVVEVPDEGHGKRGLRFEELADDEGGIDFLTDALDGIYSALIDLEGDIEREPEEIPARIREAARFFEPRNVRPRLDTVSEPERERAFASTRAPSEGLSWPNISDIAGSSLHDLPVSIARHLQRAREAETPPGLEEPRKVRKRFVASWLKEYILME